MMLGLLSVGDCGEVYDSMKMTVWQIEKNKKWCAVSGVANFAWSKKKK
jgi:hypothetical protein